MNHVKGNINIGKYASRKDLEAKYKQDENYENTE